MILAPFQPGHLVEIELQRKTVKPVDLFSDPAYGEWLAMGDSRSVFGADGELKACLGVSEMMLGIGVAWAMFSQDAGRYLPAISLHARRYLAACRFRRIEAWIDPTFAESVRWAKMMKFEFEGVMRQHSPTGDAHLYSWLGKESV